MDQATSSFTGATISESASLVWVTIVPDPRAGPCVRLSASPERSFRWHSIAFPAAAEAKGSWRIVAPATRVKSGTKIIFEVSEDEVDGGC